MRWIFLISIQIQSDTLKKEGGPNIIKEKLELTHNGQIEPYGPGLRSFEVHSTSIQSIVRLTHIKDLQSSSFWTWTSIKHNSIVSKNCGVHPMATRSWGDIRNAGNVDSTSSI